MSKNEQENTSIFLDEFNEVGDEFAAFGNMDGIGETMTIGGDDWVDDLSFMHRTFGFHDWLEYANEDDVKNGENPDLMRQFLDFRIKFLQEELGETIDAVAAGDPEEIVDGLIDLCVVAIGTLDIFGIDGYKAWNEVNRANMDKNAGVKPNRPNPLGLPDLMKPEGWVGPDHTGNHGRLTQLFSVMCDDCGVNPADKPHNLCPGCEAYKEHQV